LGGQHGEGEQLSYLDIIVQILVVVQPGDLATTSLKRKPPLFPILEKETG